MIECPQCQKIVTDTSSDCRIKPNLKFFWRIENDDLVEVEIFNVDYPNSTKFFLVNINPDNNIVRIFQRCRVDSMDYPNFDHHLVMFIFKRYLQENSIQTIRVTHEVIYYCLDDCLVSKKTQDLVPNPKYMDMIKKYVLPQIKPIDIPDDELTPDQLYDSLDEEAIKDIEAVKEEWRKDE